MKGLLLVVAIAVAALLVYNYVHTGKLTLVPSSLSTTEEQLQHLERRLTNAHREFQAAGRAAGLTGVDTSADAEAARREVERIEADLKRLEGQLDDATRQTAAQLKDTIKEFKKELR